VCKQPTSGDDVTTRPLLIALPLLFLSTSALAAPVFMLQFGSFETKAEAETRLKEVTSKHTGLIGALPSSIREVSLPPDNLTVYRTQAGPLPNRAAAQSVCSQLASNGDQCYVVETAVLPGQAPVLASAQSAVTAALPSVNSNVPSLALPSVELPSAATPSVADEMAQSLVTPSASTEEINRALDEAASKQAMMAAPASAPTISDITPVKKPRSFWSRLNPFSSDEAETAPMPAPPAPVAESPKAAPVDAVIETAQKEPQLMSGAPFTVDPTTPPPPRPIVDTVPAAAPVVPAEPVVVAPTPLPELTPVAPQLSPVVTTPAPAIPQLSEMSGMPSLPPPPPPLRAQDRDALAAGRTPASAPIINVPQSTGSLPAVTPPAAVSPSLISPAAPFTSGPSVGASAKPQTFSAPLTAMTAPSVAPVAAGYKTLWAEIGKFPTGQEALGFWDAYRGMHPDFPVVRARVITPYLAKQPASEVTLRVGPFAREESIRNLCVTIPKERLRCHTIIDMGEATGSEDSRYQR
jgi:hypothetical protein